MAAETPTLDPVSLALESRNKLRTARRAKQARRLVLANELEELERRADEVRTELGARIAAGGADTNVLRAKLAALHVDVEGLEAGIAHLDAQIRTERAPLERAERAAVRAEISETLDAALKQASETRAHADRMAESHARYIERVRKITRLSRVIGDFSPLDLEGSHASLYDVGDDGRDLWSILLGHGIGRDFSGVGERFAVLGCRTDDVDTLDDEDDVNEDDLLGDVLSIH